MFDRIDVLQAAQSMARYAGRRQALIATNIANSDTPGYRARDLTPFAEAYREPPGLALRATRPGHLPDPEGGQLGRVADSPDGAKPNGNTVSLEKEMVKASDLKRDHDLALAVYSKSLDILRASLGRAR